MTGHLVFSTLHTNDAASSFARLTDMGVEPYLVASSLEGVLAQRLVRRICTACKIEYEPSPEDVPSDFPHDLSARLFRGKGCRECRGTGYFGRTGIYELLTPTSVIRQMTMDRANTVDVHAEAVRGGMTTLAYSGYRRVLEGETTLAEVARVTKIDDPPADKRSEDPSILGVTPRRNRSFLPLGRGHAQSSTLPMTRPWDNTGS